MVSDIIEYFPCRKYKNHPLIFINVYRDQIVDVRQVKQLVMLFTNSDSKLCHKPHSGQIFVTVSQWNMDLTNNFYVYDIQIIANAEDDRKTVFCS